MTVFILSLLAVKLIEVTIKQQHKTIQLMWHQYLAILNILFVFCRKQAKCSYYRFLKHFTKEHLRWASGQEHSDTSVMLDWWSEVNDLNHLSTQTSTLIEKKLKYSFYVPGCSPQN
jgi:hypothetical protein